MKPPEYELIIKHNNSIYFKYYWQVRTRGYSVDSGYDNYIWIAKRKAKKAMRKHKRTLRPDKRYPL